MKRLNSKNKEHQIRVVKKRAWRKNRRLTKLSITATLLNRKRIEIYAPKVCAMHGDHGKKFIELINNIQHTVFNRKLPIKLNLDNCEEISGGAALVLAAEVQRARSLLGTRRYFPIIGTYPKSEDVFATLSQLGFFDLLDIKSPPEGSFPQIENRQFILMRHGIGQNARASAAISDFASSASASITSVVGRRIVSALNESLENTREHAYFDQSALHYPSCGARWWMAGHHDSENGSVHLFMYDQGLTIPGTLPRFFGSRISLNDAFSILKIPFENDGDLIRLAANLVRTRTGKANRGKGIQDILHVLRAHGNGQLLIRSRNGSCTFEFDSSRDSRMDPIRARPSALPFPIHGT